MGSHSDSYSACTVIGIICQSSLADCQACMDIYLRRVRTLLFLDLGWAYRFSRKRLIQWWIYKNRKSDFYEVAVGNVKVKLGFVNKYHHSVALGFSQGEAQETVFFPGWMHYKAKRIYDIGGYNGIYGLLAAKAHPDSEVVIFEPAEINYRQIKLNIQLNQLRNCTVVQAAVTEKEGVVHFTNGTSGAEHIVDSGTEVKAVSLSSLPPADLIKIDAEGAEVSIMRGLTYKPVIFCELHPVFLDRFGESETTFWQQVDRLGLKSWFFGKREDQQHYLLF